MFIFVSNNAANIADICCIIAIVIVFIFLILIFAAPLQRSRLQDRFLLETGQLGPAVSCVY